MTEKKSVETEDDVPKLVREWVEENYAEFNEGGLQCGKHLYRDNIFARSEKYQNAPDEYLKTMLKTLRETIKWYFNLFQTVFIAGIFGLEVTLFVLFLNSLSTWIPKHPLDLNIISWVLPLIIAFIIAVSALKTNKKSQSPWLSNFIQTKFYILHNLKELHIEIYYISKILKIREAERASLNHGSDVRF
jgi:hypothetical protein